MSSRRRNRSSGRSAPGRVAGFVAGLVVGLAAALAGGQPLAGQALAAGAASDGAGSQGAAAAAERRLPEFEGRALDGSLVSSSRWAGRRLLVFSFNPGLAQALPFATALARIAPLEARHNFAIVGVAMGLDPARAGELAARAGLRVPILDDSSGDLAQQLGVESPVSLLGRDAEGRVGLGLMAFQHDPEVPAAAVEARLREYLRLPRDGVAGFAGGQAAPLQVGDAGRRAETTPGDAAHGAGPATDPLAPPIAPAFEGDPMGGGARIRLADFAGRPLVLVFFLPSCPHCREALTLLGRQVAALPAASRPAVVGVSMDSRSYAVAEALEQSGMAKMPVLLDGDRAVATAYGSFGAVPDLVMIDAAGRIAFRDRGWSGERDANLLRMRLARLVGLEAPMLLERQGFSGSEACAVCHPAEAATWKLTAHAQAMDTLAVRGSERDPKCVGCHVVGYGEKGGYSDAERQEHLENVGCESCHGAGGGHLSGRGAAASKGAAASPAVASTKQASAGNAAPAPAATSAKGAVAPAACARCHDEKHSLGFDYATFLPHVSHAAIASMDADARRRLVASRGEPRDLLPKASPYVGSAACQRCHEKEHAAWSAGPHARAADSLRRAGKDDDQACVRCHVTGYGRPGGFAEGTKPRAGDDLARVGCESCHGPGAAHVADGGKQRGLVVALGDKCESCVILQVCGACHDDANDPGFRFDVARKVESQRHGPAPMAVGVGGR